MDRPFLEGLRFDLGPGQVSWLPSSDRRAFPGCRGLPSGRHALRVPCDAFFARSQWRDRAGFAPDFPSHQAVLSSDSVLPGGASTVRADKGSVVKGSR